MKKYLFVCLVLFGLLITPVLAQTSVADQIVQLRAQIATLTAQLNQLLNQEEPAFCFDWSLANDLKIGSRGPQVSALHSVLIEDGEISNWAEVKEGIFDEVTASAAMRFQEKYASDILTPNGLKHGTGFIGKSTRAKLNSLYGCNKKAFITPVELGNAKVGDSYNRQLVVHGLRGGINWSVISGNLPTKMFLSQLAAGNCLGDYCPPLINDIAFLTGTPTNAGVYSFTIQATDGTRTATQKYTLAVKGKDNNAGTPVISGVSGPTSLKVGEKGTWKIKASDPENGTLDYSVVWGDEIASVVATGATRTAEAFRQTATFEHTYNVVGVYSPVFTVRDNQGNQVSSSLSVNVGNTASTITVLSPNSGPNWIANSTQIIKWSGTNKEVDLYLDAIYPCGSIQCTPPGMSYILDKNIVSREPASYGWIVATDINDQTIPVGQYKVRVCLAGTNTCDSSDASFAITPSTTTQ